MRPRHKAAENDGQDAFLARQGECFNEAAA